MKSRYSYRQKILKVKGKLIKQLPNESRSQYWARVQKMEQSNGVEMKSWIKELDSEFPGWANRNIFTIKQVELLEHLLQAQRFEMLEWFRAYTRRLERQYPHPTTEESEWLGNIWDMIHCAGKEDYLK